MKILDNHETNGLLNVGGIYYTGNAQDQRLLRNRKLRIISIEKCISVHRCERSGECQGQTYYYIYLNRPDMPWEKDHYLRCHLEVEKDINAK